MMPEPNMAVIRIPYVNAYADRYGKVRRYFRKPGRKAVPLPGVPGSAEFMAAYQAALGQPTPKAARQAPGTVGTLVCDYLKSPAFSNLKPASQRVYRAVLDRFATLHGHRMVSDMPRAKVAAYIHTIGAERPSMANLTKAVLRKLLAHGVRIGYRNDNPITEIDRYKGGTRHTWTEAELAAFEHRWPLGTRERLAYALLLYTGQTWRRRCEDAPGGHFRRGHSHCTAEDRHGAVDSNPPRPSRRHESRPSEWTDSVRRQARPSYTARYAHPIDAQGSCEGRVAAGMRAAWVAQGGMPTAS
jgi:hypothetical protein